MKDTNMQVSSFRAYVEITCGHLHILAPSSSPRTKALKTQVVICSYDLLLLLALNAQCTVNSGFQRKPKGEGRELCPEAHDKGLRGLSPKGEGGGAGTEVQAEVLVGT